MKKSVPRADSVLAYLRFKGWTLVEKTEGEYIVTPPAEEGVPDFRLRLPRWEKEAPYYSVMVIILTDVARVYNWKLSSLIRLLSKSPRELDKLLQKAISQEEKKLEANEEFALAS